MTVTPTPTPATRSQLRAVCPACFATQAVPHGRLAQHGYRRPQHWHQNVGVCSGAGRPHFGTDAGRDYTASLVTTLRATADQQDATAAQVLAGTAPVMGRKRVASGVAMTVLVDAPTPRQRDVYAATLTASAASLRATATDFAAKVAAWTPVAPVTARVAATAAPLWHLYSAGSGGKFCASSRMGARGGLHTSDLTAVTCPKCLAKRAALAARQAAAAAK